MREIMVNGRWPLQLLEHRAARPEWPFWEAHTLALANHLIEPGMVVWDIGAEEGDFPALWGSWGAEVVMVEPNPHVWPQIRLHWQANVGHAPLTCLVGFASDTETHPVTDYPPGYGGVWPLVAYGEVKPDHGFRTIPEHGLVSPQYRMDDLHLVNPDLVMMDIEGGEFTALRGMVNTLEDHHPQLIVSVHPAFMAEVYGEDSEDLHRWMADLGYHSRPLCFDHEEHWWFW